MFSQPTNLKWTSGVRRFDSVQGLLLFKWRSVKFRLRQARSRHQEAFQRHFRKTSEVTNVELRNIERCVTILRCLEESPIFFFRLATRHTRFFFGWSQGTEYFFSAGHKAHKGSKFWHTGLPPPNCFLRDAQGNGAFYQRFCRSTCITEVPRAEMCPSQATSPVAELHRTFSKRQMRENRLQKRTTEEKRQQGSSTSP